MEIINWLRGNKIGIMTLQRMEHDDMPEDLANKPLFTQWVYEQEEDSLVKALNDLVGSLGHHLAMELRVDDIEVEQNDELRDKTPDCGLVVDITVGGELYFRLYVTNFVKQSRGWV